MLRFDVTFEAEDVDVAAVVMATMSHLNHSTMTALGNQKMLLANHEAERTVMTTPLVNLVTTTKLNHSTMTALGNQKMLL